MTEEEAKSIMCPEISGFAAATSRDGDVESFFHIEYCHGSGCAWWHSFGVTEDSKRESLGGECGMVK